MKVERTIEIEAPPERVYETVIDPDRLGEWVTIHVGLKSSSDGELREGSEMVQCLKMAGRRFDVAWKASEVDRPRLVVWEGRGPAHTSAKVVYELEGDDGATRFHYLNEYKLPGGPIGAAVGRALKRASSREAERSLERLKALLEG
jgi:carbon monoxide dehydrogenase subunit G